jgi:hypothetical protein
MSEASSDFDIPRSTLRRAVNLGYLRTHQTRSRAKHRLKRRDLEEFKRRIDDGLRLKATKVTPWPSKLASPPPGDKCSDVEAARRLKIDSQLLTEWVKAGRLTVYKGGTFLVRDLQSFAIEQGAKILFRCRVSNQLDDGDRYLTDEEILDPSMFEPLPLQTVVQPDYKDWIANWPMSTP